MCENERLRRLEKKINTERKKLDILVLQGLERDELLNLSCKLDDLINEYNRLVLDKKDGHEI